tara:strand:+ start:238 stop:483 length:246 start_codon:yes stop_codon:yes gene_type:complete
MSSAKENGAEQAFAHSGGTDYPCQDGLTKREYFAGLAMQGLCANPSEDFAVCDFNDIAGLAIRYADALLDALAEQGGRDDE